MTQEQVKKLREFALEIRIGTVECIKSRGFGHIGGSLSVADLLAVLYGGVMNEDPADPKNSQAALVSPADAVSPQTSGVLLSLLQYKAEKIRFRPVRGSSGNL